MKIPNRDEVYGGNKFFFWFLIYETIDAFVFIAKWFFILFFLYLLFADLGVTGNFYISDEKTPQQKIHADFTIKLPEK